MAYSPRLHNEDMAPTPQDQQTWNMWEIAALWVGMSVCIPTYMLAGSLIRQGLSWLEAIGLIMAGNVVVLVPMILNAHAGTKYGIPFPVLLRTSFGHRGAHIPAVLRALVACGWFGIQTWIGGEALHLMLHALMPEMWPDTFTLKFAMYLVFWVMNLYFVWNGTESIRWLESWAAPLLLGIGVLLLGWGVTSGGGMSKVLDRSHDLAKPVLVATRGDAPGTVSMTLNVLMEDGQPKAKSMELGVVVDPEAETPAARYRSITGWVPYAPTYTLRVAEGEDTVFARFDNEASDTDERTSSYVTATLAAEGEGSPAEGPSRWILYLKAVTAMVAFWATLALNIPDITRFAKSQRDQAMGQAIGLPLTMGLYSFIGLAVTCATLNIFPDLVIGPDAIENPVTLLARFESKFAVVLAMFMLAVATLTTNIAANIISPANCFSNLMPETVTFRTGGMIAAGIGVAMMPWRLLGTYIGWLLAYSGLLGPIMGVMVADYVFIRKFQIDVDALYTEGSEYEFTNGFNVPGVVATGLGVAVVVAGMVFTGADGGLDLSFLAEGAWFSGALTAALVYTVLAKRPGAADLAPEGEGGDD